MKPSLLLLSLLALSTGAQAQDGFQASMEVSGQSNLWMVAAAGLDDGGAMICGYAQTGFLVIRNDANGQPVFAERLPYPSLGNSYVLMTCGQWSNGDLFLFGSEYGTGVYPVYFVLRLDPQGAFLWSKTYAFTGGQNTMGDYGTSKAYARSDGHLLLSIALMNTMIVADVDGNGQMMGARSYARTDDPYCKNPSFGLAPTDDGGVIVCGKDSVDQYLVRTNAAGDVVWAKTYSTGVYTHARGITRTQDGNYVICGFHDIQPYAMKVDAAGNVLWHRTYSCSDCGGAGSTYFERVDETPSGTLVFSTAGYDAVISAHVDAQGLPLSGLRLPIDEFDHGLAGHQAIGTDDTHVRMAGAMWQMDGGNMTWERYFDWSVPLDGSAECQMVPANFSSAPAPFPSIPFQSALTHIEPVTTTSLVFTTDAKESTPGDFCSLFTGVDEATDPASFTLMPSMVDQGSLVEVIFTAPTSGLVQILDAGGRLMMEVRNSGGQQLNLSTRDLQSGCYAVRVLGDDGAARIARFVVK